MEKMKSIVECVCAIFTKTCRGAFWYRTSQIRVLMQLRKPIPRLDVKGWMVEWVAILVNTDTVEVLTWFDINKMTRIINYIFEKYTSNKLTRIIYVHAVIFMHITFNGYLPIIDHCKKGAFQQTLIRLHYREPNV